MGAAEAGIIVKAGGIFFPDRGFVGGLSLFIQDGLIKDISADIRGKGGHAVLDFGGHALSPPFCDHHLHFSKRALGVLDEVAESLTCRGIPRVLDGGSRDLSGIKARERLGNTIEIHTPGYAIYKRGYYGKYIGKDVAAPAEATALIDELREKGADYVKIINSGILDPRTGAITPGGFTLKELSEIVDRSREGGMRVYCHANGDRAVHDAVVAGVSAVVHGFFVADGTISLMAEKRVDFIPTVNALLSLAPRRGPATGNRIGRFAAIHLKAVKKASESGVRVLPGSDAGPPSITYGTSYLEELALLRKAGLSLEQVLAASVKGPLEKGEAADFLVLDGLSVKAVFKRGGEVRCDMVSGTEQ